MLIGGGFGVGLTVAQLCLPSEPGGWNPPEAVGRPARLTDLLPVEARTPEEKALELGRVRRMKAALAAYEAALIAALADDRPADEDRRPGEGGAAVEPERSTPGVSEFFPDELAAILHCSRAEATTVAEHALTLRDRLPATWAALADGELDWPRARAFAAELGWAARDTDPAVVAAVEAALLPTAAELSVSRLKAALRRELLARDAFAADRRRKEAERAADVVVRPLGNGMAELVELLPLPLAIACRNTYDGYARAAKEAGDPRPIGQLRVGALVDLSLRPWDTSREPVTAHLTVVAQVEALKPPPAFTRPAPSAPMPTAEVDGQPITAAHVRELLTELDALCPGGLKAPAGGSLDIAIVDATGGLRAVAGRRELERIAARGCPAHPDGATSAGGDVSRGPCTCPVLDKPAAVDRYRPSAAQRRFVITRDRTCRHPGCRARAAWADLDHVVAHAAGGETDCDNLCCLCRRHHRLKTHAKGWRYGLTRDGVLSVTTPSGVTRVSRPPGFGITTGPPQPPPADTPPEEDPPPF